MENILNLRKIRYLHFSHVFQIPISIELDLGFFRFQSVSDFIKIPRSARIQIRNTASNTRIVFELGIFSSYNHAILKNYKTQMRNSNFQNQTKISFLPRGKWLWLHITVYISSIWIWKKVNKVQVHQQFSSVDIPTFGCKMWKTTDTYLPKKGSSILSWEKRSMPRKHFPSRIFLTSPIRTNKV